MSQHNNYNLQHGTQFKNNSWPLNTLEAAGISNHQLVKSIPEKAKDSAGTLHRLTYQLPTGPQTSSGAKFQNYVSAAVCCVFFPASMKMAWNEIEVFDKSEGWFLRAAIISHWNSVLCAADAQLLCTFNAYYFWWLAQYRTSRPRWWIIPAVRLAYFVVLYACWGT